MFIFYVMINCYRIPFTLKCDSTSCTTSIGSISNGGTNKNKTAECVKLHDTLFFNHNY